MNLNRHVSYVRETKNTMTLKNVFLHDPDFVNRFLLLAVRYYGLNILLAFCFLIRFFFKRQFSNSPLLFCQKIDCINSFILWLWLTAYCICVCFHFILFGFEAAILIWSKYFSLFCGLTILNKLIISLCRKQI